jgi:hypothetical protein
MTAMESILKMRPFSKRDRRPGAAGLPSEGANKTQTPFKPDKKQSRKANKQKNMNDTSLPAPTQTSMNPQWWSKRDTHRLQRGCGQCLARKGRQMLHVSQCFQSQGTPLSCMPAVIVPGSPNAVSIQKSGCNISRSTCKRKHNQTRSMKEELEK